MTSGESCGHVQPSGCRLTCAARNSSRRATAEKISFARPSIFAVQATNAKTRRFQPNRFSECELVYSFEPLIRVIRHNQNTAGNSDVGRGRILPERRPGAIERPGPEADEPQSGLDGDCRRLRAIRDNDPHCLRRIELSRQHSRQLSGAGCLARCCAARSWRTGFADVNPNPSEPRQPWERRPPRPHVPPQGCRSQKH
jgi:hypothetical protein